MAYQFTSASSQYLSIGSAPVTSLPITIACRFNTASGTVGQALVAIGATTGSFDNLLLFLGGSTTGAQIQRVAAQSALGTTSADNAFAGADYTTGAWNHAAAVYATNNKVSYYNGLAGTASTNAYTTASFAEVLIGARRGSGGIGGFANCGIAEVGIWGVALSAAEISSLSAGFTPDQIRPQSLVFYAPLIRELRDLRGGRTITAVNSPTVANHPRVYA